MPEVSKIVMEASVDIKFVGRSVRSDQRDDQTSIVSPIRKSCLKRVNLEAIRNNIKTAEIPQFLGIFQKYDQESSQSGLRKYAESEVL